MTFGDLTSREKETFRRYVEADELVVRKEMTSAGGRAGQKYYGMSLQNPEFAGFREATSARERQIAYRGLKERDEYRSFPNWRNQEAAAQVLKDWEEAHPNQCERQRDEGQFFGFREVGEARLERYTRFVFIPAVLEASQEASERKGAALTELLDLVVRKAIMQHENVKQFETETQERFQEIMKPENLPELQTLAGDLASTLDMYAPGASVQLPWLPVDTFDVPLPRADPKLVEDEYATAVERAGHGLQRAFVLTLLQYLAIAKAGSVEADGQLATSGKTVSDIQGEQASVQAAVDVPDLILAIEEPELYQHPDRQRHLSKILLQLATGKIEGVARRTQVIYATHSPLFVGIDRTNQIRVLRKVPCDNGAPKHTRVSATSLDKAAKEIERAHAKPAGTYTGATLTPRLVTLMTPWMNEGFFAHVVVLVEGEEDRAAILGAARASGYEFESKGISVIPCNGKANLDRPTVIFRGLGIPVYTIWDSDKDNDDPKPEANRRLLRLFAEEANDWPDTVSSNYACFERDLNTTVGFQLGQELFDSLILRFRDEFGYATKEQARKSPMVIERVVKAAREQGKTSQTLENVVRMIVGLT